MSSSKKRGLDPLIVDAEARVFDAVKRKSRITDADITVLSAAWRAGYASPALSLITQAMVNLVLSKMTSVDKGWMAHRSDEYEADIRLWVLEQLSEFNPGKGAFAAMIAERSSWIISQVNRKYAQGGGEIDRNLYHLRAAALSERERILLSTGVEPAPEVLKAATREKLLSDIISKDPDAAKDPFASRGRALAALKKSGKSAALEDLSFLLSIGEYDDSLDRELNEEDGFTLGDTLHDAYDNTLEGRLEVIYNLCLGGKVWARPVLASQIGLLGGVEGISSIAAESDFVRAKGLNKGDVAVASGIGKSDIGVLVKSALSRAISPHAHWAHLAQYSINLTSDDLDVFDFDFNTFNADWLVSSSL